MEIGTGLRGATLFYDTFGCQPQGVWAAPGRVNLIGEHTDYNAGLVLPIALPQRTYAAAARRSDGLLRLVSEGWPEVVELPLAEIGPGWPSGWAKYPAGVLWALAHNGYTINGMDVAFTSDVPIGAGLSSSAAIEGAMALAASDLYKLGLAADDTQRTRLADLCRQAENEIALAPTGGMDQAASLRCRDGYALFLDCRDDSVQQVPFDLASNDCVLLVIDTRTHHQLSDGQYGARRADCEQACRELGVANLRELDMAALDNALAQVSHDRLRRRVRHVVTEIDRVTQAVAALRQGDFDTLGLLFTASHESLRTDYEVSCPELDTAVSAALGTGALGARMTGGGFGGSAIALVKRDNVRQVRESVNAAFADAGFAAQPGFLEAVAAPGGGPLEVRS
ncbi:MAG: galactokinase [Propionibacteriaceae bacterium]|jgi:galactokinase|nr:galactokinase [Propionibacteriaceae bacterium]